MLRGGLFTREYLLEGIKDSEAWKALDEARLVSVHAEIDKRLKAIRNLRKPNEAETEKELIWPVLEALGWKDTLPQQNLSLGGREKVPRAGRRKRRLRIFLVHRERHGDCWDNRLPHVGEI
jgi:hypothetical protein